jgi:recombination protein U
MENVLSQKGLAFVLLHFTVLSRTFLLKATDLISFYKKNDGQKSMSLAFIEKQGYEIPANKMPSIPYLDCIQQILGGDTHFTATKK